MGPGLGLNAGGAGGAAPRWCCLITSTTCISCTGRQLQDSSYADPRSLQPAAKAKEQVAVPSQLRLGPYESSEFVRNCSICLIYIFISNVGICVFLIFQCPTYQMVSTRWVETQIGIFIYMYIYFTTNDLFSKI